jgi:flagellar biosynthesis/type III secretory pathway M-ring protein FliF/YscJ
MDGQMSKASKVLLILLGIVGALVVAFVGLLIYFRATTTGSN